MSNKIFSEKVKILKFICLAWVLYIAPSPSQILIFQLGMGINLKNDSYWWIVLLPNLSKCLYLYFHGKWRISAILKLWVSLSLSPLKFIEGSRRLCFQELCLCISTVLEIKTHYCFKILIRYFKNNYHKPITG